MAAETTDSSVFPLFSSLPLELRNKIWQEALPDNLGPALYFYKKGCWCPRRISESHERYNPESEEDNLDFQFCRDLLNDIHVEVPQALVNREARTIALAWARAQGLKIRSRDNQNPVFMRSFDITRDALYIAPDRWHDFLDEPDERLLEPDVYGRLVHINSDLKRIAIPETLLLWEVTPLPRMFWYFPDLEAIFIIVDPPPDLQPPPEGDLQLQPWWEFESSPRGAFSWDRDRGSFDYKDGECVDGETPFTLTEEATTELSEAILENDDDVRSLDVRPILTVRR